MVAVLRMYGFRPAPLLQLILLVHVLDAIHVPPPAPMSLLRETLRHPLGIGDAFVDTLRAAQFLDEGSRRRLGASTGDQMCETLTKAFCDVELALPDMYVTLLGGSMCSSVVPHLAGAAASQKPQWLENCCVDDCAASACSGAECEAALAAAVAAACRCARA